MNRWCLVGVVSFVAGCGLFKVNVNGEVKTLGGSSESSESDGSDGSKTSDGSGKSEGSKKDGSGKSEKSSKENADALRLATREIRDEIDKAVMETPGALPADKLAQLQAKKKELAAAGLKPEARYLDHLGVYYKIEDAWRGDAAKTPESLAGLLAGSSVAQGELTGKDKAQTFKFKAEEGKCYTVLLRMKTAGGSEDRMSDFWMDAGKESSSLQRYHMDARRTRGSGLHKSLAKTWTHGACALKATDVTVSAKLQYAGSQNGVRYVVVATPRDSLPEYLTLNLEPQLNDSCDADNWVSLWTNPIPGSVLYGSEAPYIPFDVGTSEDMWMTAYSAGSGEARVKRDDLSSAAPKQFKFNNKVNFRGCPKTLDNAHSADGIKVATCYERLNKKYDPQFDAAQKARNNAVGILAQIAADRRMTQLNNSFRDEESRTCKKLEADVGKKFEAAYGKIVDFYNATPVKNTFDRGAALKLTYDGAVEIGCVGRHSCSL